MDEAKAIALVEQTAHHEYVYEGDEAGFHGQKGHFEVLDDLNCCAPTNNVLFAFYTGTRRKVMDANGLADFFAKCKEA